MSILNKFDEFEKQQQNNINLNSIIQEINFIKCEIKTIKNENKNIRNKIDISLIKNNQKNIAIEVIERIKINKPNTPKLTKRKINMAEVVNEFKNINIKTYLTKVPKNILNKPIPKSNPNSYHKFILKLKQSMEA